MEKIIARVEQIAVTMLKTNDGERKFALRHFLNPSDEEGVLLIQHLMTEKSLTDLAKTLQQALKYLEKV